MKQTTTPKPRPLQVAQCLHGTHPQPDLERSPPGTSDERKTRDNLPSVSSFFPSVSEQHTKGVNDECFVQTPLVALMLSSITKINLYSMVLVLFKSKFDFPGAKWWHTNIPLALRLYVDYKGNSLSLYLPYFEHTIKVATKAVTMTTANPRSDRDISWKHLGHHLLSGGRHTALSSPVQPQIISKKQ